SLKLREPDRIEPKPETIAQPVCVPRSIAKMLGARKAQLRIWHLGGLVDGALALSRHDMAPLHSQLLRLGGAHAAKRLWLCAHAGPSNQGLYV
ncbi:MAG: hypothetical protein ACKO6H_06080, partial [Betaproteobacteria bacterium]